MFNEDNLNHNTAETISTLTGVISKLLCNNSNLQVVEVTVAGYANTVRVVFSTKTVFEHCKYSIAGAWEDHPIYGHQFRASDCNEIFPDEVDCISAGLEQAGFRGIGEAMAKKITDYFGADTIDIIISHPERLSEIRGMGQMRISSIIENWTRLTPYFDLIRFLHRYGIDHLSERIYTTLGVRSLQLIKSNPYHYFRIIDGFTFEHADHLGLCLGISKDDNRRIRGGIYNWLYISNSYGNVYENQDELISNVISGLGVSKDIVLPELDAMINKNHLKGINLYKKADRTFIKRIIYLPEYFEAEVYVANKLNRMIRFTPDDELYHEWCDLRMNGDSLGVDIDMIKELVPTDFDEDQKRAISLTVSSKVSVITGGPGVGKTTTLEAVVKNFEVHGLVVRMAAFTGKAAKRMNDAVRSTQSKASTIHRLLEYSCGSFQRNDHNPIIGDVLILDEASMIELLLMADLLKAVPDNMRIVIVGDDDQLPSIGPGKVLRDIIESGIIPCVRLRTVHRQGEGSSIITNAHRINEGIMPEFDDDFRFIECSLDNAESRILHLITCELPVKYGITPSDALVLTPMKEIIAGTNRLNSMLQNTLNHNQNTFIKNSCYKFYVGDPVIQTKNDYFKGIMNGECGVVTDINMRARKLWVRFDDRIVPYSWDELDHLLLGYALTIHKSQGSEYPVVIIPVFMTQKRMLQRNLIYTAVTRAKCKVILVGELSALRYAISQTPADDRKTMLKERLSS